jgi:hypothetical protein
MKTNNIVKKDTTLNIFDFFIFYSSNSLFKMYYMVYFNISGNNLLTCLDSIVLLRGDGSYDAFSINMKVLFMKWFITIKINRCGMDHGTCPCGSSNNSILVGKANPEHTFTLFSLRRGFLAMKRSKGWNV